jgi:segregation and condensation protein A
LQHSIDTEFYNQNTASLNPELNDVDEMENIQKNIDDSSLDILVEMAKHGEINPWDVDLEKVTSKYLQFVSSNKGDNLKEAGRAIFYASVLLRMKSDFLLEESNDALRIGLHKELDDDALLQEELDSHNVKQITFDDLESAIRRKYISKAKRFRKLTLKDLINALQEAKEEEETRIYRKQQKLLDLEEYTIVAPDVEGDIMNLTHAENLEDAIDRLRILLPEYLVEGAGIEFEKVIKMIGNWSNAFLATIFLAHEREIEMEQEEYYGELWLYEPSK